MDECTPNTDRSNSGCLYLQDGYLYCDELRVTDIREGIENRYEDKGKHFSSTPFYLYNKSQLLTNVTHYTQALDTLNLPYILGYAIKANHNMEILKLLRGHSPAVSLTLVSGYELLLALKAGFPPSRLMMNGNGKMKWEIELAAEKDCLINVDSGFGMEHTIDVSRKLEKPVRVLLRLNPDIDPDVHPYISTGLGETKFGVETDYLDEMLVKLQLEPYIKVVGLHCHLGSTIDSTRVFRESVVKMLKLTERVREKGFKGITYLNIGGGLGINYTKYAHRTSETKREPTIWDINQTEDILNLAKEKLRQYPDTAQHLSELFKQLNDKIICLPEFVKKVEMLLGHYPKILKAFNILLPTEHQMKVSMPTPADLVSSIADLVKDTDLTLILEPGRSIVGDTGCLVTQVIGCKQNGQKKFIVVDGAMTEVVRPSMYGAYHHVELAEPTSDPEPQMFDIVGPVCESGDFLAKERFLPKPHEGCTMVVFDTGAYCSSMGSNYNLRIRPAEVLVDKDKWSIIREPESFDDLAKHSGVSVL